MIAFLAVEFVVFFGIGYVIAAVADRRGYNKGYRDGAEDMASLSERLDDYMRKLDRA